MKRTEARLRCVNDSQQSSGHTRNEPKADSNTEIDSEERSQTRCLGVSNSFTLSIQSTDGFFFKKRERLSQYTEYDDALEMIRENGEFFCFLSTDAANLLSFMDA